MDFECVVFPGQGIQHLGMGKDFGQIYPETKLLFDQASQSIGIDLYNICQHDEKLLNLTEYTQPCILTLEVVMYEILKKHYNLNPKFFAGHSLGEYTALVANGVMPLEVAAQIVNERGKLMQSIATNQQEEGCMAAIIMDEIPCDKIDNIAKEHSVDLANHNSIQQIVISGAKTNVSIVIAKLQEIFNNQNFRAVYLTVNSAFHSRYMKSIEPVFKECLLKFQNQFDTTKLTNVISNYSGTFYLDNHKTTLINNLTKQISGSVKWQQNMKSLLEKTTRILEIGPATPLRGFFRSIGINIDSISNTKSISKVFTI